MLLFFTSFVFLQERCQDPGHPQNGWKIGMNHSHGGSVRFACRNGPFYLVGASSITCLNGEWTNHIPSCEGALLIHTQNIADTYDSYDLSYIPLIEV